MRIIANGSLSSNLRANVSLTSTGDGRCAVLARAVISGGKRQISNASARTRTGKNTIIKPVEAESASWLAPDQSPQFPGSIPSKSKVDFPTPRRRLPNLGHSYSRPSNGLQRGERPLAFPRIPHQTAGSTANMLQGSLKCEGCRVSRLTETLDSSIPAQVEKVGVGPGSIAVACDQERNCKVRGGGLLLTRRFRDSGLPAHRLASVQGFPVLVSGLDEITTAREPVERNIGRRAAAARRDVIGGVWR